ncbi:MAG: hypothetical protein AABW48_03630 [Nanoarchaeota archaeon]
MIKYGTPAGKYFSGLVVASAISTGVMLQQVPESITRWEYLQECRKENKSIDAIVDSSINPAESICQTAREYLKRMFFY